MESSIDWNIAKISSQRCGTQMRDLFVAALRGVSRPTARRRGSPQLFLFAFRSPPFFGQLDRPLRREARPSKGQKISESANSEGYRVGKEGLIRDGGSADSVSICCSRNRLLPPSDIKWASFVLKLGKTNIPHNLKYTRRGISVKSFFSLDV